MQPREGTQQPREDTSSVLRGEPSRGPCLALFPQVEAQPYLDQRSTWVDHYLKWKVARLMGMKIICWNSFSAYSNDLSLNEMNWTKRVSQKKNVLIKTTYQTREAGPVWYLLDLYVLSQNALEYQPSAEEFAEIQCRPQITFFYKLLWNVRAARVPLNTSIWNQDQDKFFPLSGSYLEGLNHLPESTIPLDQPFTRVNHSPGSTIRLDQPFTRVNHPPGITIPVTPGFAMERTFVTCNTPNLSVDIWTGGRGIATGGGGGRHTPQIFLKTGEIRAN